MIVPLTLWLLSDCVTVRRDVLDEPPLKVAVTLWLLFMTTLHVVDVPEQAPPQPANVALAPGAAVSTTVVPEATDQVPLPPGVLQGAPPQVAFGMDKVTTPLVELGPERLRLRRKF